MKFVSKLHCLNFQCIQNLLKLENFFIFEKHIKEISPKSFCLNFSVPAHFTCNIITNKRDSEMYWKKLLFDFKMPLLFIVSNRMGWDGGEHMSVCSWMWMACASNFKPFLHHWTAKWSFISNLNFLCNFSRNFSSFAIKHW